MCRSYTPDPVCNSNLELMPNIYLLKKNQNGGRWQRDNTRVKNDYNQG